MKSLPHCPGQSAQSTSGISTRPEKLPRWPRQIYTFCRSSCPSQDRFLRFPDYKFESFFLLQTIFDKYVGEISRKNNKGVLGRPWTKWRVLRAISSTLKFQYFRKSWKVDFLITCNTKSCQSSREYLRMLRAFLPDTARPPQFQLELRKNIFCGKLDFSIVRVALN